MGGRRPGGEWEWQADEKTRVFPEPRRLHDAWGGNRSLTVDGEDAHHLARVLRLRRGDPVVAPDGAGDEWVARVERVEGGREKPRAAPRVVLRLFERRPNRTEPPLDLVLVQGIPKGDKMDVIVQKSVEIGATRIVPALSRRAVPRFDETKAAERASRWRRIAREAARQSRRGRIPAVEAVQTWEAAVAGAAPRLETGAAAGFVAWEMEARWSLASVLHDDAERPEAVYVCIGPEGGLDAEEVAAARRVGFRPVSLGPRILRTETAGMVALCLVSSKWGDMG